jgi:hypothetical protein
MYCAIHHQRSITATTASTTTAASPTTTMTATAATAAATTLTENTDLNSSHLAATATSALEGALVACVQAQIRVEREFESMRKRLALHSSFTLADAFNFVDKDGKYVYLLHGNCCLCVCVCLLLSAFCVVVCFVCLCFVQSMLVVSQCMRSPKHTHTKHIF